MEQEHQRNGSYEIIKEAFVSDYVLNCHENDWSVSDLLSLDWCDSYKLNRPHLSPMKSPIVAKKLNFLRIRDNA